MNMKPLQAAQSFIFGGQTGMTYEQMLAARQYAQQQRQALAKTPTNVGEGWGAILRGLAAGRAGRRADATATEGREKVQSALGSLLQGRLGGASAMGYLPPREAAQAGPVSGAFAGSAAASGQFPASLVQSESGGNWKALNDEGYGGRLQFGAARLADAARAGVIPAGMTGAQFSQLPPEQQQAVEQWHFADIDSQAQRMGLDRYIGQNVGGTPITQDSIRAMAHLGGIGGAAKFLQSGGQYNPSDSNGTSLADYARQHGGGGDVAFTSQMGGGQGSGQGIDPRLMEIMSDPYISELPQMQQGALAALFQQQLAQAYPEQMTPYQQAQIGMQREQMDWERQQAMAPQAVKPMEINGQLVDPTTGQVLGDYRTPNAPPAMFQTLPPEEVAQLGLPPGSYQRGADGKISQIGGSGVTVNNQIGGQDMTPGQKKIDEAFADTYLNWNGGGYADSAKQIEQLQGAIGVIDKNGDNITGAVGLLPPSVQAFVNPQGIIAKEAVEEVVQRSLREVLGAQFTAAEGERLIARAYNPLLSASENRKRVSRLLTQITEMGKAKQAMVDYFDEHGTLRGYKGQKPTMASLAPLMEAEAQDAPQASAQPAQIGSRADYDALPSGARFIAPDGSTRIKP